MKIDFSSGNIYVGDVVLSVSHEAENKIPDACMEEHGRLTPPADSETPLTLMNTEKALCVFTHENQSIPPMSELPVQGPLNANAQCGVD